MAHEGEAVLTNQSKVPIVAYIIEVFREPCNPIEAERHIYLGYDAASSLGDKPILPSKSHIQNIGASNCNKSGTHSPAKASLQVARFADGTIFGDKRWAAVLQQNRVARLNKINGVLRIIEQMGNSELRQQYLTQLEKANASFRQEETPEIEFRGESDPFETAIRLLRDNSTAPGETQVANLLSALKMERSKLQSEFAR